MNLREMRKTFQDAQRDYKIARHLESETARAADDAREFAFQQWRTLLRVQREYEEAAMEVVTNLEEKVP